MSQQSTQRPPKVTNEDKVLAILENAKEPLKPGKIAQRAQINPRTASSNLTKLTNRGVITNIDGKYILTSKLPTKTGGS